jgi:glycosyltransferase involved in cell wall biosynthesis
MDVIRALLLQGHEVVVMAADDEFSGLLTEAGCLFIPIRFNNRTESPLSDFLFYRHLKQLYRQHRPALIFHYVIKPNIYGSLAAAAEGIPSIAVITGLGYAFARRNWLFRLIRLLYKRALSHTNQVWFLNNDDAKMFINEKMVSIEKVKVLPGEGVNEHYFSPTFNGEKKPGKRFRFLMSTRLLKSKGIGIYANAAHILKKKNYDLDFELIGFFEEHHPDSISRHDIDNWEKEGLIVYSGFARDVRPFLYNADCFIFPSSYNEGIPRGLMEAACMELPIITSANRGCKEVVIDNVTGYLCNMNDPFDLSDKMERIINMPAQQRINMGKKGRELVADKFNVQRIVKEYEQTIYKLGLSAR